MIIHHPPAFKYNGVVLELGNPGRHDGRELVGGWGASSILRDALAGLQTSRLAMDIRTRECTAPYPEGTKVVVLSGELAIQKLGQARTRLNTLRGAPHLHNGIVYLPTFHPQDCADMRNFERTLNKYVTAAAEEEDARDDGDADDSNVKDMGATARRNYRFWFIQDIRKAVDIARNGYHPNNARYHTGMSPAQICALLRGITADDRFYFDIETERTTGRIICFAFSKDAKDIYCVPVLGFDKTAYFGDADTKEIFRQLACAIGRARVVAHNALFDLFICLWRYKIPPPPQGRMWDTMVAHARLFVDVEKSLGHCISLCTHQPYHKDEGIFEPRNLAQYEQLLKYNAKDVEGTALIHEWQLRASAHDQGLRDSITQGNELIRPLLLKSFRGLNTDTDALCKRIDENTRRARVVEERILAPLAGGPLNPRSPKQVAELLYVKFGLPRSTDPRVSLTGKDQLYRLALKFPLPILKVILHIRKLSKETGQISCKLWRESRITCAYVITGTKTFRLSSRALLDTFGTNTQNWAKHTRALITARPGYTLVQVDQSGAEALIVAYLCPPGRYRDLFIHKISPHVYTGLWLFPEVWQAELGYDVRYLFETPIAELGNDPRWKEVARCIKASDNNPPNRRYYYFAKQTNHSSNYDIQPGMFAKNLLDKSEGQVTLSVAICAGFLDTYHLRLYPEIRRGFHNYVKSCLVKNRTLRNLFGYPREFYAVMVDESSTLKDAYSWIPQSTVGVITSRADCALQRRIDAGELNFAILQNNHDSLLAETPEGTHAETGKIMMEAMNQRMRNFRGEEFAMRSEASYGPNWYEMEVIK